MCPTVIRGCFGVIYIYIKPTDRTNHDPKDPCHNEPKKKIRKRNITWFNPPFSKNVATNVGNKFFTLLSSCFPPNNKLHKIINKNTVKLSYSCMNNVQQIINSHNKTILTSAAENNNKLCNCREKNSCPLNGKCLQKAGMGTDFEKKTATCAVTRQISLQLHPT